MPAPEIQLPLPQSQSDSNSEPGSGHQTEVEVLIVGAGFAGIYLLHKLRSNGFKCLVLEAGNNLGGTWNSNRYPGSRVDTDMPLYQLSIPEVWSTWTWTEKFPCRDELAQYFQHVDEVLNIRKDVLFDSKVVSARYLPDKSLWNVRTQSGARFASRFLLLATGFASKPYVPTWPGSGEFQGIICHSAYWPSSGIELTGKRVAIIGTGATGVQMAQEVSRQASHLYVLQRTPNLCLPMRQRKLDYVEQAAARADLPRLFKHRLTTLSGYADNPLPRSIFSDDFKERRAYLESLWNEGGFKFWTANYHDVLVDAEANRIAYDFWAEKTRVRIPNPEKRDLLAPVDPPHAWGCKRPSLETDYYEQLSKPHVSLVDVNKRPIVGFTKNGIQLADGGVCEVDVVVLATGFDALTGSMLDMGLTATDGTQLPQKWSGGVGTYLGTTLAGYPNLFYVFAVHGPTASNGPSCIELQSDWIVDVMVKMRDDDIESVEPTAQAEAEWTELVHAVYQNTLVRDTRSWYDGSNVPDKRSEPLIFCGGFPMYRDLCYKAVQDNWRGFDVKHQHGVKRGSRGHATSGPLH
ncbi:hypothetical protein E4U54_008856 [Claviceps lovelessii]|nr:hypothetical protein E4U54_008856 [Claviceps lovelessii]